MITGYDVSAARSRTLVAEYGALRDELPQDDAELSHEELTLLSTFADLCELSRNRPTTEEEEADEQRPQPAGALPHLPALPRCRAREPAGCVPHQLSRALSALRRHGPGSRARAWRRRSTGCSWPSNALPTRSRSSPPCSSAWLLDRRPARPVRPHDEIGEVLDRLIVATQLRYPAVGDLARSIRFRLFDQPLILRRPASRSSPRSANSLRLPRRASGRGRLRAADRGPGGEPGAADPVACLSAFGPTAPAPEPMLEVLTRRYYKVRRLEDVRSFLSMVGSS